MKREHFQQLQRKGPVLFVAAVSSESGIEVSPPENRNAGTERLREFKESGCTFVCCPTVRGTVAENRRGELLCRMRQNISPGVILFGTVATAGGCVEPFGERPFEDAVSQFTKQGTVLAEAGAAGFFIRGMTCIQEARAALIALRDLGNVPVIVEMVFGPEGKTEEGTDQVSALITLQSLGADAVGFSCSGNSGTAGIFPALETVKPFARVPLFALPDATHTTPEQFAAEGRNLVRAGANLLGVGRGGTPDHIASLGAALRSSCTTISRDNKLSTLSSARGSLVVGADHPFAVVGERINPTGKKKLQADLREGSMVMVEQFAIEQLRRGASVLDVNMGLSGIDEMAMMLRAIRLLSQLSPLPLCIDTTRPEVVEAALRLYPGRALVNSVSGERERIEQTLPCAAKYGAMIIVLPLTDAGIPATVKERIGVMETIMAAAGPHGVTVADVVVDGLVMTISSNPAAAADTLDLIEWCSRSLRSNTIVGLSNVSFGMPQREWINGAFLGMAMGRGLTMAIANPSSDGIMASVQSYNAVMGHDGAMLLRRGVFKGARE